MIAQLAQSASSDILFVTLCALLVVIVTARSLGGLLKRLGQPPVIGEILGGIVLGPSVLSAVAPHAAAAIFPPATAPFLSTVSQLGVLLFMFLIGLELDLDQLKRSGRAAILIAQASILAPFLLGLALSFTLLRNYAPMGTPFASYALFIGTAIAVTAFPVLARILTDSGLNQTPIGALSLTCAAIDDATAWCLLALAVGLMKNSAGLAVATLILSVLYVLFMFKWMRPILQRRLPQFESDGRISEAAMAVCLIALLASSVITEFIGIHALFGSFLLGVIVPHESTIARDLRARLEGLVRVFFLPAFFAFTGLRTQIGLLGTSADWMMTLIIVLVASLGKIGGAYAAARMGGLTRQESAVIGALMNTRGLVGLIVLNAGLDYGVLSPKLFTMLVIMAVATTAATGPLLNLFHAQDLLRTNDRVMLLRKRR